jgi:hypothetical protein
MKPAWWAARDYVFAILRVSLTTGGLISWGVRLARQQ